jgi:hypothetical protein
MRKENESNQKFIILNTFDYYQSIKPEELSIKVHREYEAAFLLNPTLLYQIVYSKFINNKFKQCSIIFKYDVKNKKFINNLEIWDGELVTAVCPLKLKHHKTTLFEYIVQELEATHGISVHEHNKNAVEEYKDLVKKFMITKELL